MPGSMVPVRRPLASRRISRFPIPGSRKADSTDITTSNMGRESDTIRVGYAIITSDRIFGTHRRCQSKISNTWSGHRTAQIDSEKCRKINDREIRF